MNPVHYTILILPEPDFSFLYNTAAMSKLFFGCNFQVMDNLGDVQQLYLDKTAPNLVGGQIVTFWAKDPYGKREILLDGRKIVYAVPGLHCDHSIQVTVTSRPKSSM